MRRREFATLIAGAAAGLPLTVRAQQSAVPKRVGVLNSIAADDKEGPPRVEVFQRKLKELGWIDGQNIAIDYRWVAGGPNEMRAMAREMIELKPDVLVSHASIATAAFRSATSSIPVVFVNVADPIGPGFVSSLARPGGNITGFTNFESAMGGKWLEILKDMSPGTVRVGIVRNPKTTPFFPMFWTAIEAAAAAFALKPIDMPFGNSAELATTVETFSVERNSGLLVIPDISTLVNRDAIIEAAARNRLPAVYPYRFFVGSGGLISYGVDNTDQYQRTASYVDRILRGVMPSELPVQLPVKFVLVINLKTAKALGLEVPPMLLARADEVIE